MHEREKKMKKKKKKKKDIISIFQKLLYMKIFRKINIYLMLNHLCHSDQLFMKNSKQHKKTEFNMLKTADKLEIISRIFSARNSCEISVAFHRSIICIISTNGLKVKTKK